MVSFLASCVNELTPAALQHVDNLRIKKSDYDVLGRIGEGQFGVVSAGYCLRCRSNIRRLMRCGASLTGESTP